MQDYHRLKVYDRALELAVNTREATERFPKKGYVTLQNQMVSAAESIPLNIAEGAGADTSREFARFLGISIKSTNELEAQLELTERYRLISDRRREHLLEEVVATRKMLCALRRKVRPRDR